MCLHIYFKHLLTFEVMTLNLQQLLITLRGEESLRLAAKRIGLSHSYYRTLELGYNPSRNIPVVPSADTLAKIAAAYKVDYMDLVKAAGYEKDPDYNFNLTVPFSNYPALQQWYENLPNENIESVMQLHAIWQILKGSDRHVL